MPDVFDEITRNDMFDEITAEKPIGFIEAAIEDPLTKIPFSPAAAAKTVNLLQTANRLQSMDYKRFVDEERLGPVGGAFMDPPRIGQRTPEEYYTDDVKRMTAYFEDMAEKERRGYSLWGRVGQVSSMMPAFMMEFMATGGIKQLGSQAARNMAQKILKETVERGAGRAVTGVAAFAAGAATRAAVMPHRAAEAVLRRQIPQGMKIDETGKIDITGPKESKWTSLWKGLLDHYIEIASEETGEFMGPAITKIARKLPLSGRFIGALQRGWLKLNPNKTINNFYKKMASKAGFHGVVAEIGEEDIGWISRAIFDIEDFGAGPDANMWERLQAGLKQDIDNLPVEAISFSIPGGAKTIGGRIWAGTRARAIKEPGVKSEEISLPSTDEIISSIAEIHNREGGSTISLETGQPITEGYAVAIKELVEEIIPFEQITDEQIKEYKEKHKAILAEDPKRTIGTWVSEGKTYLDISTVVPTQAEAEKIGRATNQKAIFDLGAKQDIAITPIEKAPVVEGKTLVDIQKKLDRAYKENDVAAFNRILERELAPLPPEKAKNILQGHAEVLQMEMKKRKVKAPAAPVVEKIRAAAYYNPNTGEVSEGQTHPEAAAKMKEFFPTIEEGKPAPEGMVEGFVTESGRFVTNKEAEAIAKRSGQIEKGYKLTEEERILGRPAAQKILVKPKRITKKRAYAMGHQIPETLGWDEEQRRDFMEQTIGVRTMKGISLEKARTFAMALDKKLEEAGLKYEPPVIPADELVETLERTRKVTAEDPIKALNRRGIYKLRHALKSGVMSFTYGLERIERFIEGLDGHTEGVHYEHIWRPMKEADETSIENTNREVAEFISHLESQGIDTAIWLGKLDLMPGTKIELTASQRIGIYTLSQNKNGMRYLTKGMNLSLKEINAAKGFMSGDEIRIANWLSEQYEAQWPIVQQAAAQAGIDPATLKKEYRYSPLIRTDVELEEQTDFLSELAEQFRQESFSPEKGMLEKRKEKAVGRIELDAFVIYMHNIARVQRFIAMAPVANKVGKILNNRKFKQALNDRTFNQGNKLLNSWMKDAVRGTSSSNTTSLGRAVAILRRNGILYAIGYNLPSSLRQTLSMSNAMAVDPLMLKYNPGNIARAITPWGYKKIESFVFDRSKLVETRSYDRDLRQKWNRKALKQKLRRKAPWSKKVMTWIRWMDKHTTVTAWKSLYDVGMEKFDGNETQAINYADKWISRTQPMANAKDLPQYFRGGQLEKLLTTFQNQINNNGNFYMYDILGAKKAGQISLPMAGYRIMFSYVLPAIMFGMIGRAGPPRTLKDVIIDLLTYPVAPVVVIGRWIDRIIRGWGQTETVAEIGPEAFVKLGREIRRGRKARIGRIIKYAAMTIGSFTGRIPAQAIRTTEGIMDLISEKTDDLRRLIYSKWALEQGEPPETGTYRRTR